MAPMGWKGIHFHHSSHSIFPFIACAFPLQKLIINPLTPWLLDDPLGCWIVCRLKDGRNKMGGILKEEGRNWKMEKY
jgi:hypothetical protein